MKIENPYAYGKPSTDPREAQTESGRVYRHEQKKRKYTNQKPQPK